MDSEIFYIASIIGSIAFGLSGLLLGVRKDLDVMGLFIVAMLTANGGGVVRDVLVGKTPNILVDITGFIVISVLMLIFLLLNINKFDGLERKLLFIVSDSVGLVAFSITGAMVGLDSDLNLFGVMLLAFITATGGGIVRDIFVNEVPSVLSSGFYGSVAILVGLVMFILGEFEILNNYSITGIFIGALCVRLVAHRCDWHLPKVTKGS